MNRPYHHFYRFSLPRIISQLLLVAFVNIAGLGSSFLAWNSTVNAQSSSSTGTSPQNTDIINYSRALLKIESVRQQAFENIKKIIGNREIPKMACNDPSSLNNIPSEARDIAVNYCNRSQEIVKENGLTIQQFNDITLELQKNEELKNQIYRTMIRLQKNPDAK